MTGGPKHEQQEWQMKSFRVLLSIAAVAGGMLGACKGEDHTAGPLPAAPDAPAAEPVPMTADLVFSKRCATCHGASGRGDGPGAQALKPRPRDYTDSSWQKSVSDAQIKKTIIEGGASVGKSTLMAPNADLADNPAVLDGLVKIIRDFGQSPGASPSAGSK
jgi:mono/diheme cytochrome c family protein